MMLTYLQLNGGKKAKKGLFNGASTLVFGKEGSQEKMNYGLKNNKCLKIGHKSVTKIVGSFVNDLLEVRKKSCSLAVYQIKPLIHILCRAHLRYFLRVKNLPRVLP